MEMGAAVESSPGLRECVLMEQTRLEMEREGELWEEAVKERSKREPEIQERGMNLWAERRTGSFR